MTIATHGDTRDRRQANPSAQGAAFVVALLII